MDIEHMELEQLKEQENYLRKELSTISEKIENYNYRELEKTYGDMFHCSHCRYDIGLDFSSDGWHNLCGNPNADTCTCCGGPCTKFKPDTQYTKWLKHNTEPSISPDFQRAILLCFKVSSKLSAFCLNTSPKYSTAFSFVMPAILYPFTEVPLFITFPS